jgi:hypothetical protein
MGFTREAMLGNSAIDTVSVPGGILAPVKEYLMLQAELKTKLRIKIVLTV